MDERSAANRSGMREIALPLAVVIPCGVLAGLYLATAKLSFLVVCLVFALAGVVLFCGTGRVRRWRATRTPQKGPVARGARLSTMATMAPAVRPVLTRRILKLLALAIWLFAWTALASLYARVAQNASIAALTMLVLVGGISPVLIYAGLESGVRKLGRRIRARG